MARRRKGVELDISIERLMLAELNKQIDKWKKEEPGIGGLRTVVIVLTTPLGNDDNNIERALEELQQTGAATGFLSSVSWGVSKWEEM